ncbi:MAG: hypothetical protein HC905_15675 [Bacteroidales bacterium]|nr:hypothetical protein [Bacteroidales bacterium]
MNLGLYEPRIVRSLGVIRESLSAVYMFLNFHSPGVAKGCELWAMSSVDLNIPSVLYP